MTYNQDMQRLYDSPHHSHHHHHHHHSGSRHLPGAINSVLYTVLWETHDLWDAFLGRVGGVMMKMGL